LFAPAGTPQDVINKLNATVHKVSADSELRSRLVGLGLEVQPSSPAELGARMRLEKERWTKVAKEAGIEPQ
jgi:tripartite-type tricarboxylate transporter receptor subunit TctC